MKVPPALFKKSVNANVPLPPLIVPLRVIPEVVAVPAPTSKTDPPLRIIGPIAILPVELPRLPLLVTRPVKVKVPEVEVTIVPVPIVEAPVTVRPKPAAESVPLPEVVRVPATVEATSVIVATDAPDLMT